MTKLSSIYMSFLTEGIQRNDGKGKCLGLMTCIKHEDTRLYWLQPLIRKQLVAALSSGVWLFELGRARQDEHTRLCDPTGPSPPKKNCVFFSSGKRWWTKGWFCDDITTLPTTLETLSQAQFWGFPLTQMGCYRKNTWCTIHKESLSMYSRNWNFIKTIIFALFV